MYSLRSSFQRKETYKYIKAAKSCTRSSHARTTTTRCLLKEQIDPTFAMQAIKECKVGYL